MKLKRPAFLGIIVLALFVGGWGLLYTAADINLHGQQAIAFLNGHVDLLNPPLMGNQDTVKYDGKLYSPLPPAPALILLPLIVVFGPHLAIGWLVLPLVILSAWMLLGVFDYFDDQIPLKHWLIVGFIFGTGLWTVSLFSFGPWQLGQCVGLFFIVLALFITYRCQFPLKGWAIGVALGTAFLSRQLTIVLLPFFLVRLWNESFESLPSATWQNRFRQFLLKALGLASGLGIGVLIYLAFNKLRFGNPLDTGYGYTVAPYSLYSLSYLPFNLMYFLIQGFHAQFTSVVVQQLRGIDPFGTGLLVASPFLVAAFYARMKYRSELIIAWVIIVVMIISQLMYYSNGQSQINTQRYSLDYLPLLMILVGLGTSRLPASLVRGMVIWAVALNCIALYIVLTAGYAAPVP